MEFFRIDRTIPFMRHALVLNAISFITFILAVFFIVTRGFHLSIEFTGGTVMEVNYTQAAPIEQVRTVVSGLGYTDFQVQNFGTSRDLMIRLPLTPGQSSATQSETVMKALKAADDADIILFNTCSVREKAQEKVFSDLGRIKHLKALNPNLVIGVGGCVASQEGSAIVDRAPYVDVVFGPQTLHRLPELIARRKSEGRPQVDISFPEIEKFDAMPPPRVEGAHAFVSIMEGCSKYCSFCVVPYTRGEEISRPFDDVLTEVADLADQGVKEVTLLGQNVNAYRGKMGGHTGSAGGNKTLDGLDHTHSSEIADFATLLEYVHEIPGIERIRYTTSHPKEMTTRMTEVYARLPKLVSFLHLPVQAGSDRILAAMKRGYTAIEFKSVVRKLRAARPGLTMDLIARLIDALEHDPVGGLLAVPAKLGNLTLGAWR